MSAPVIPEEAVRAGEQAWLRILRRLHPDVTWTIRPRRQRNAVAATGQIRRPVAAPDERRTISGKAA